MKKNKIVITLFKYPEGIQVSGPDGTILYDREVSIEVATGIIDFIKNTIDPEIEIEVRRFKGKIAMPISKLTSDK